MRVSVFCSSAPNIPQSSLELAFDIGKAIGQQGWDLVWGGGKASMMGQVAKGAREAGSVTIGVIPEPLKRIEFEDAQASQMHVVDNMRNPLERFQGHFSVVKDVLQRMQSLPVD